MRVFVDSRMPSAALLAAAVTAILALPMIFASGQRAVIGPPSRDGIADISDNAPNWIVPGVARPVGAALAEAANEAAPARGSVDSLITLPRQRSQSPPGRIPSRS